MHPTIYVDLDSTFWPAEQEYDRSEKRLFGTTDLTKNWYNNDQLRDKYGENYTDIFWDALDPDKVMDRVIYPSADNALLWMRYRWGFDVHFITHNPFPDKMEGPLREWLDHIFEDVKGFKYDLTIRKEGEHCKIETMDDDPTAWGIIDDVPRTQAKALKHGYTVLSKRHPWNQNPATPGVMWFDDWVEVYGIVDGALELEVSA